MSTAPDTPAATADSLTAFLTADHQRLGALWSEVERGIARDDFKVIQRAAKDFIANMRAHIGAEERVLFPALNAKLKPQGFGPTELPHEEHAQMLQALDGLKRLETVTELWTAINAVEGAPVEPGAWLRSHASKEEAVLYPLMDKTFSSSERSELMARLRESGISG